MKYIKQLLIILFISLIGELLNKLLPLPIPASIYGILLLFTCLLLKIIKLEAVKDISYFLLEIMPLMFIPAGVSLLKRWDALKPIIIPILVIIPITVIIVMAVTGLISQAIIRKENQRERDCDK